MYRPLERGEREYKYLVLDIARKHFILLPITKAHTASYSFVCTTKNRHTSYNTIGVKICIALCMTRSKLLRWWWWDWRKERSAHQRPAVWTLCVLLKLVCCWNEARPQAMGSLICIAALSSGRAGPHFPAGGNENEGGSTRREGKRKVQSSRNGLAVKLDAAQRITECILKRVKYSIVIQCASSYLSLCVCLSRFVLLTRPTLR